MKHGRFLLSIGTLTLSLISCGFFSTSLANSTSGAPVIMCMDCHAMPKGAEIKLENLPKSFQAGAIYEITLSVVSAIKSQSDMQGGFSVSVTDGELIVSDPKTTQKSNGFITHTAEGALLRSWKFKWKAPQEKKKVTLRVSVIAADGDFSPANDGFARREFIIQPKRP